MAVTLPNAYSWTREEFHRAVDHGVFGRSERLELVEGQVLEKMTQYPPHAVALTQVLHRFVSLFGHSHALRCQMPIALSNYSEPEPDLVVVPGEPSDYLKEHPTPEQIELLVEVSDSTLSRDRRFKVPLYAKAGIKEVWLVDVEARRIEAYQEPSDQGYQRVITFVETESLAPLFMPTASFVVAALLPKLPEETE
jgi:Uma2 family endonuclease